LRLTSGCVDRFIANSEAVKTAAIAAERMRPEQVDVIYNGVARLDSQVERASVRHSLGVGPDEFVAIAVANLRPLKRMDVAIQALALVRKRHPAVRLIVAGGDRVDDAGRSQRQVLEERAASLGIGDRVLLLGEVQEPMSLMQASDVGLLCSETEGLSNSLIEYGFAGKPAVCTNVGGNPELVLDGETGYLVPAGDPEKLAERMCQLIEDPELARRMGEKARRRIVERFDAPSMVRRHEHLYEMLASGGGPS
jgi:glycosyltransferase involved in cell wall biosynthesis